MSRIGKKPVAMPSGVSAEVEGQTLTVKGPKGSLAMALLDDLVTTSIEDGQISIKPVAPSQRSRAAWGLQRTNVQNLVTGVTEGFTKVLEINGVGYRAQAQGKNLKLQLGYSHEINFPIPQGITIALEGPKKDTIINISGISKQQVGQVAAEIRGFKKPEPYQGKGVKYKSEIILRKEGKKK